MGKYVNSLSQRDFEKIIAAIIYIVQKLGGTKPIDHHTIFKTMYLADKRRLAAWGTPIFNEEYIKMEWGPVPSTARDIFKKGASGETSATYKDLGLADVFNFHGESEISAKIGTDLKYLAPVDILYLDESIEEIRGFGMGKEGFAKRSSITHDSAWLGSEMNRPIPRKTILLASGNLQALQSFEEHEELEEMIR